jgi:hypothetical protein
MRAQTIGLIGSGLSERIEFRLDHLLHLPDASELRVNITLFFFVEDLLTI